MRESAALRWVRRSVLAGLGVLVGLPLFVLLSTSVTPLADTDGAFSWLPQHITFDPYAQMWTSVPLARYLINSLIVATAVTVVALLVAVPAGYALARSRVRGTRAFGALLLATQAAPGLLFALPLFLLYAEFGRRTGIELLGSYTGLIITDLTFALPLVTWLLAVHIAALPRDVEDAARVDGAGTIRVLVRIVVPLAAPAMAAAGVFAFLLAWGEVLFATILTDERTQTLPVGLHGFVNQNTVYWNQLAAAALTTSAPIVVGFLVIQHALSRTLVVGSGSVRAGAGSAG